MLEMITQGESIVEQTYAVYLGCKELLLSPPVTHTRNMLDLRLVHMFYEASTTNLHLTQLTP
jgi:hypothetical protein